VSGPGEGHPLLIRTPWKRGSEAADGRVVVSATRFRYRSVRDLAPVSVHALRLRRGWGARPGAVGLLTGSRPFEAVTYSLSVWTSEEGLRGFLRAPDHVDLMRRYRPRLLDVRSVVWETDDLRPAELWREGLERLAETA
jgi:hypothetical protein